MEVVTLLILSYLTGSIPTSIIVSRMAKNIDIREHGSGNAGATNVYRILGWKYALIVLSLDIFKAWLPTAIYATKIFLSISIPDIGFIQILCGFSAVLGHTYPIFSGFKGGKGIGSLIGVLLALFPFAFPLCLIVAIFVVVTTGYVSLGSIFAAISLPIIILILPGLGIITPNLSLVIFSLLVPWFVIYTHRSNISRIRNGTENRFDKALIIKKRK
ncbi:MAG: glycerol-3-phosphate 1-O-acyltransferase PlsY [Candidatus Neomarinimicrobiota bacterium]|nr:glycerol-3-phosphate 1-O-acyltransferase PlsY [Candidatus Neomarinimicrobiota bacterium]MEE3195333.1 glycerol-3-phosphate 1-O-acyltransferase PlsY [Candidatus Neomarinimicrobiota bacterium]